MIDELITEIKRTEREADERIRSGVIRSKEIVQEAKKAAEEKEIKAQAELREMRAKIVADANSRADEYYDEIISEAVRQADFISKSADVDRAVKTIIDKVLG